MSDTARMKAAAARDARERIKPLFNLVSDFDQLAQSLAEYEDLEREVTALRQARSEAQQVHADTLASEAQALADVRAARENEETDLEAFRQRVVAERAALDADLARRKEALVAAEAELTTVKEAIERSDRAYMALRATR